ncbi:hypothetical protein BST36_29160 [Mycolicibacterium moriokaense]|uniref:Uncharacterized protein n=1 Tax=Mycolicibacterium moriokaense TaxID=39691 RepID=A0AAD1HBH7_9MYCO|nr:hypothetical protein [Mycolicibacterium moriokaense]MCV7037102.1 hypothetical protein [Mycolicibacterium moriokaense]ORB13810.1 hypothetical protein BST36_29160 [Mycolicibacterium moriokaense]BBX02277.1 hypothetical protein MMOR_32130 [Mycolicibacterium moriokaense]
MTHTDAILANLDAAGVFSALPVDDGEFLVAALSFDVCLRGDPALSMRSRASAVRAGRWPCEDRAGVAQALDIAATLMESR